MKSRQQTIDNIKKTTYPLPSTLYGIKATGTDLRVCPSQKYLMHMNSHPLVPEGQTRIMGILNVTPDSFYDGGRFPKVREAIKQGLRLIEEGAGIVDVGGVSTRPGSRPIPIEEELKRVLPVIKGLASQTDVPLSIDTYRAGVAEKALEAGATMVNDVSGLGDKDMAGVAASHGAKLVIMHLKGKPHCYPKHPVYRNIIREVSSFLQRRIEMALEAGVKFSNIIVDPGLGFGKTASQSLELLRRLGELKPLGLPIMIGPSRKSFIGKLLGVTVEDRLPGTLAVITLALLQGASIIRVHDVKEAVQVAALCAAFKGKRWKES